MSGHFYPVGTAGKAWGDDERAQWLALVGVVKRSYSEEVLARLEPLRERFDVVQYGALSMDAARYPLFCVKTRGFDPANGKPCVLVTGGTHGYEASGVQGALLFCAEALQRFAGRFNVVVCPCVSPWGYECIQRWNAGAIDPNRSYVVESEAEECAAVVDLVAALGGDAQWLMHLDLHETTDTDDTEFRPAKASRDGLPLGEGDGIPDGFYLIGDAAKPQPEWHRAMIDAVRRVTHIAPPDADGTIVGLPVAQEGVVNSNSAGKGKGVTNASFATTTEVYPDSKIAPVTAEQCNQAQCSAIVAGLEHIIANVLPPFG
jgi:hypothetical protein